MATSFDSIAKLMLMEMQDNTISKMDTDIAYDLISDLIITSATVDFSQCKKNLDNYIPYSEFLSSIKINENKNKITIDRKDKLLDKIIVRVNDIEIEDVDYEFIDTNLVITYNFKENDDVKIIEYFTGEFNEDLTSREKYIIALASNCHFLNQKILKEDNLRIHLGDKDYSMSSSWNTLKMLTTLKEAMDKKLKDYIDNYTFDGYMVGDLI